MDLICEFYWLRALRLRQTRQGHPSAAILTHEQLSAYLVQAKQEVLAYVRLGSDVVEALSFGNRELGEAEGVELRGMQIHHRPEFVCTDAAGGGGALQPFSFPGFEGGKTRAEWELLVAHAIGVARDEQADEEAEQGAPGPTRRSSGSRSGGSSASASAAPELGTSTASRTRYVRVPPVKRLNALGAYLEALACSILEIEVLSALSRVRADPQFAADQLKQRRLGKFKGKDFYPGNDNEGGEGVSGSRGRCVVTKEGEKVVQEAISYCEKLGGMGAADAPGGSSLSSPGCEQAPRGRAGSEMSGTTPDHVAGGTVPPPPEPVRKYFGRTPAHQNTSSTTKSKPMLSFTNGELLPHPALHLSAADHAFDLGRTGYASHTSSDEKTRVTNRISRYGNWGHKVGECLWYGTLPESGYQVVEDLIVDDGVPSRGHRLGVFDPAYFFVGIAIQHHKTFGFCCALNFANAHAVPALELDGETSGFAVIEERMRKGPVKIEPAVDRTTGGIKKVETQWGKLGVCGRCGEDLHGGSVIEANKLKYHKECFACWECGGSLVGIRYFSENKPPELYCEGCHLAKFGKTCFGCKQKIKGTVMTAAGQTWHPDCFKCDQCGKVLKGGPYHLLENFSLPSRSRTTRTTSSTSSTVVEESSAGKAICGTCMEAGNRSGSSSASSSRGGAARGGSSKVATGAGARMGRGGGATSMSNAKAKAPVSVGKAKSIPFAHHMHEHDPVAGTSSGVAAVSSMSGAAMDSIVSQRGALSGAAGPGKAAAKAGAAKSKPKAKPSFGTAKATMDKMTMGYGDIL